MSAAFEELDFQPTALGDLVLRRRFDPVIGRDVFEVRLGDAFLMSSAFHDAEVALAERGLAGAGPRPLDVVVGGLGLGYTAAAALDHPGVRSVIVVEALAEVIGWHRRGLVPLGERLAADPRCVMVHADFFALASGGGAGFVPGGPARRVHAVLLDVDHSPRCLLDPGHAAFYEPPGLAGLAARLHPGGVFALWSNDPPDDAFVAALGSAFDDPRADTVEFPNPYTGGTSANTVYVARAPGQSR